MKKLTIVGLILMSFSLLISSCSREQKEINGRDAKATSHAAVVISMGSQGQLREGTDDFNKVGEWEGKDKITNISVYIVDKAGSSVAQGQYTLEDFNVVANAGEQIKLEPKKAIKTSAGEKNVYVVVNASPEVQDMLSTVKKDVFETNWKKVTKAYTEKVSDANYFDQAQKGMKKIAHFDSATKEDVVMMTNAQEASLVVVDGVTFEQALATTNPKNRIKVAVERLISRIIVTTNADSYTITERGTNQELGTISNLTFAVAQGESAFYTQKKVVAGETQSPAFAVIPGAMGDAAYDLMKENYDYSDLSIKDRSVVVKSGAFDLNKINEYGAPAYLLEATHKRKSSATITLDTYDGDFRKNNTAYILIRSKFTPNASAFVDKALDSSIEAEADGTFYLGLSNNKLYAKKESVIDPAKGGIKDQEYRTYKAGKVLYYAYVNPDIIDKSKTMDSPVYRNNVYHVNITGIKALGYNWNPIFPENPDTDNPVNPDPKPDTDPDDLPVNPDSPLGDKEIFMSVDIAVLKWNVHSYDIELTL